MATPCGRLAWAACVLAAAPALAGPPRADRYGDPLPAGAVARLGTVRFRDVETERFIRTLDGRPPWLLFATDGQCRVAYKEGTTGRVARVCDVPGGRDRYRVTAAPGEALELLDASPDGRLLALQVGARVRLLDAATGRLLHALPVREPVGDARFSADGRRIAVTALNVERDFAKPAVTPLRPGDARVSLWDVASGRRLRELVLPGESGGNLAVGADGKTVASLAGPRTVRVWDLASDTPPRSLSLPEGLKDGGWLLLAPRCDTLACAVPERSRLYAWGLATGRCRSLPADEPLLCPLRFSPDGRTLACLGGDGCDLLHLWDVYTGKRTDLAAARPGERTRRSWAQDAFAFAPDGRTLVADDLVSVRLFDVATGKELGDMPHETISGNRAFGLEFTPDGRVLALQTHLLRFWDVRARAELPGPVGPTGLVRCVAFAPNGRTAASGGDDNVARLWDVATGAPLRICGDGTHPLADVAFSVDGRTLATYAAADEWRVRLWDTVRGRPLAAFVPSHEPRLRGDFGVRLAFRDDGAFLATAALWNSTVELRDSRTGKLHRTIDAAGPIEAMAFLSAGGPLAVSTGRERAHDRDGLALFDPADGLLLRTARGASHTHDGLVSSPDGKLVARWNEERIDLFEAETLSIVRTFRRCRRRFKAVALRADGHVWAAEEGYGNRLAGGDAGTLELRDLSTSRRLHRFTGMDRPVGVMAFAPDGNRFLAEQGGAMVVWDVRLLAGCPRLAPARLARAELERRWADLAGEPARAYRAVRALAEADAAPYLAGRLRPAAEADVGRLVRDLDSPAFEVRRQATAALRALGRDVEPALRRALAGQPSLETRGRVEPLLAELRREVTAPERLRPLRAIQALEQAGTEAARRVLQKVAGGAPDTELTRVAKAALQRLAQRSNRESAGGGSGPR